MELQVMIDIDEEKVEKQERCRQRNKKREVGRV